MPIKKHALFPLAYDEISLVDDGAAGSADVLIAKRNGTVRKARPSSDGSSSRASRSSSSTGRKPTKDFLTQSVARQKKLAAASSGGSSSGGGKKKSKGRSQSNPCSTATNSTGKKDGKSQRSKNWAEGKHPREEAGQFSETSSDSKAKNGKGGTTGAKLDAACREKSGTSGKGGGNTVGGDGGKRPRARGRSSSAPAGGGPNNRRRGSFKNRTGRLTPSQITSDPEAQAEIRRRRKKQRRKNRNAPPGNGGRPVAKSALSSWDKDIRIHEILEGTDNAR